MLNFGADFCSRAAALVSISIVVETSQSEYYVCTGSAHGGNLIAHLLVQRQPSVQACLLACHMWSAS